LKTCDLKGLAVKSAGPFCMFGKIFRSIWPNEISYQ